MFLCRSFLKIDLWIRKHRLGKIDRRKFLVKIVQAVLQVQFVIQPMSNVSCLRLLSLFFLKGSLDLKFTDRWNYRDVADGGEKVLIDSEPS